MADLYQLSYRTNINVFSYPESVRKDMDDRMINQAMKAILIRGMSAIKP